MNFFFLDASLVLMWEHSKTILVLTNSSTNYNAGDIHFNL